MTQQHARWSPVTCDCVIDILIDTVTGNRSLFCIRNICDPHKAIAVADPDFETKKAATLATRYQQLDDNRNANYTQIDSYTDLQMSPAEKAACKATVDRITAERKQEYDLVLQSNLVFCVNVDDSVKEESSRISKAYDRVKTQFNLTDAQMGTIVWSVSGTPPNRVFTINFGSVLTQTQKNNTQTWCDANIGVGKVIVL